MSELKLEVGKRYVSRDGEVVKIVGDSEHPTYPFDGDNGHSYIPNGRVLYNRIVDSDLIGEFADSDDSVNRPPHYTSHPSGIEALVCADIASRQALGIAKYGQTVADNPLALREWLQHQYEELLDAAVYCRRAIAEIERREQKS